MASCAICKGRATARSRSILLRLAIRFMASAATPVLPRSARQSTWSMYSAAATRPRLYVAAAIGIIAAFAIPEIRNSILRAVIGWDIGAAVFLGSLLVMMGRATPASMRRRALQEDEARWVFLALMAGATFFSLFAILGILPEAKKGGEVPLVGPAMLGALTILLSWLVAQIGRA